MNFTFDARAAESGEIIVPTFLAFPERGASWGGGGAAFDSKDVSGEAADS